MKQNPNLLESTKHGTPAFPFEHYHCTVPETFINLTAHWHAECEIALVAEGSGTYQIDLLPYRVAAGDMILIPPQVLHSISGEESCCLITDSFVFHMDMLDTPHSDVCTAYLHPFIQRSVCFPMVLPGSAPYAPKLRPIFSGLLDLMRTRPLCYELEVKSLLYHFFFTLYRSVPYETQAPEHEEIADKLKQVIQYIRSRYQQSISVSELASLCGFSEYHFMRFFKKHMNMTCVEYLNRYRLDMASRQLASTGMTVTGVALENGFNNISYFNRVFKKQFGMTPKEFRRLSGSFTAPP